MMMTMQTPLLVLLLTLTISEAFVASRSRRPSAVVSRNRSSSSSSSSLLMAPKYDKTAQKWTPSKPEEGPEAGYPPINTLLLHGPKPWLQRVFTPNDYEQAVLKFMSGDKCSRDIAQGNMDAYLRNPQDWAANRMEEETRDFKVDYVTLKPTKVALTVAWSCVVFGYAGFAITHWPTL